MKNLCLSIILASGVSAHAASLTWDADPATPGAQDGAGTWDAANTNWWDGTANTNWTSAAPDAALIGATNGAAGTVTVGGTQTVSSITFNTPGSGTYTLSGGRVVLAGAAALVAEADATIASVVAGTAGLVKTGPGTVTLTGTNVFTGPVAINDGTLYFLSAATQALSGALSGTGRLAQGGSGPLILGVSNGFAGKVLITNTATLRISHASALGVASEVRMVPGGNTATLEVTGGLAVAVIPLAMNAAGTNRSTLLGSGGSNRWTGPIVLDGTGIVQFTASAGQLVLDGGVTESGVFAGTFFARGTATGSVNGVINLPSGTVSKTDGGVWTIASTANMWKSTTVAVGTLRMGAANAMPPVVLTMGQADGNLAILDLNGFNQTVAGLVFSSSAGATKIITSPTAATLTVSNGADYTYGGLLAGALSLAKQGAGVLDLRSNNTFSGSTTVNAGTLKFSGAGTLYTNGTAVGAVQVRPGGTLYFARNDAFGSHASVSPVVVTVATNGVVENTNSFTTLRNLVLAGGELRANGGASTNFQAYQLKGTVSVAGDAMSRISAPGVFSNVVGVQIGDNTSTGLTTFSVADGAAAVDLSVEAPLVNGRNTQSTAFVSSGLIKSGAGTMQLATNNAYTGDTRVNEGTLALGVNGGVVSTAITVVAGATLDGSAKGGWGLAAGQLLQGEGTVAGAVLVPVGARLQPGAPGTVGTLTVAGDLGLASAYTNVFDLGVASADRVTVTGSLEPSNSTIFVNYLATPASGSYRLFDYATGFGTSFAPALLRSTVTRDALALDTATPGEVNLLVTAGTPQALVWDAGVSAIWDYGTSNWVDLATGTVTDRFYEADTVLFSDVGADSNEVILVGALKPAALTVSSGSNYVLTGAGRISDPAFGTATLVKDGAGRLTLGTTNDFTGGTTLSNGLLAVGAPSALGTGSLTVYGGSLTATNGAQTMNNPVVLLAASTESDGGSVTLTVANVVSGPGVLVKQGGGAVALTAANTITNGVTVRAGTLYGGVGNAFGTAGTITLGDAGSDATDIRLLLRHDVDITRPIVVTSNGSGTVRIGKANESGANSATTIGGGLTLQNRNVTLVHAGNDRTDFPGALAGTGDVLIVNGDGGSGRVSWGMATTNWTGNLVVTGALARLQTFVANTINDQADIAVWGAGASLWVNQNEALDAVAGDGSIIPFAANSTLTIGAGNGSGLFSGTISNNAANSITIVKTGTGTQELGGATVYSGNTEVWGGTLRFGAGSTISSSSVFVVSNGAVLDVASPGLVLLTNRTLRGGGTVTGSVVATGTARLLPGTGGVGGTLETLPINGDVGLNATSTNYFNLGGVTNAGGGFNDLVIVNGALEPSNSVIQVDPAAPLANDAYTLFTYTGAKTTFFSTNVAGNLTRKTWTLDETTSGQIQLVVSGSYGDLVWRPRTNVLWDFAVNSNWYDTGAAVTTRFLTLDRVIFDDSGAYSNTATLVGALLPSRVTVDATSNYTITGAGRISGTTVVVKANSGTVTVRTTNDFVGSVDIRGGTLAIANSAALGAVGNALTITNGGTLDINGVNVAGRDYVASIEGAGVGGNGAVVNNGVGQNNGLRSVTLAGSAAVGSSGRWDIRPITAGQGELNLAGYELTKVGTGYLAVVEGVATNAGTVHIAGGQLGFTRSLVSGAGDIRVGPGAALTLEGFTTSEFNKAIVLSNGSLRVITTSATNAAPVTLAATGVFDVQNTLVNTNLISGPGMLVKTNSGTLVLNIAHSYAGDTEVRAGTLLVGAAGTNAIPSQYVRILSGGADAVIQLTADEQLRDDANVFFQRVSGANWSYLKLMGRDETVGSITNLDGQGVIGVVEGEASPGRDSLLTLAGSGDSVFLGYLRNRQSGSSTNVLALKKLGPGTLTLGGAQIIYTGPTTLSNGTLVLSNATAFASPVSLVTGVLEFANSVTSTYARTIDGVGMLIKRGVGQVTLTNRHTYTGDTIVREGTLSLGGGSLAGGTSKLASAWIRVDAGSTLLLAAFAQLGYLGGTPSVELNGGTLAMTDGQYNYVKNIVLSNGALWALGTGSAINGLTGANFGLATVASLASTNTSVITSRGGAVAANAGVAFDVADGTAAVDLAMNAVMADYNGATGRITKIGAGVLALGTNNTYTGTTVINEGTLLLQVPLALGGSRRVSVATNAVLDVASLTNFGVVSGQWLEGAGLVTGRVAVLAGGMLLGGTTGGVGVLTVGGDVVLAAGGRFAGRVFPTGATQVAVGGTLSPNSGTAALWPQVALTNGTYVIGTYAAKDATDFLPYGNNLNPAVGGVKTLTVTSELGQVKINAADRGPVRWNGTTNNLWDVAVTPNWYEALAGQDLPFTDGDTALFDDTPGVQTDVLVSAVATFGSLQVTTSTNAFSLAGTGSLSGTGSLTKAGASRLTVSVPLSYAGETLVQGGTLELAGAATPWPGGITVNGALVFNRSATQTIGNLIGGTGVVVQAGTGLTVLTNVNTHSGGTVVSNGVLYVSREENLGGPAGWLAVGPGTLRVTNDVVLAGARGVSVGAVAGTFNIDSTSSLTITQGIAGAGGLTKTGAGSLYLGGAGSYSGRTTISSGLVALSGGDDRLPTNTAVSFTGGAILDVGAGQQRLLDIDVGNNLTGTVSGPGSLTLRGSDLFVGATNADNQTSTLVLSNLAQFAFNDAARLFEVGGRGGVNTIQHGVLHLADTNDIVASQVRLAPYSTDGNSGAGGGKYTTGRLHLGASNTIWAGTVQLGGVNNQGYVQYQGGVENPTLTLRGSAGGANRVTTMYVGWRNSPWLGNGVGTFDLVSGVSGTSTLDVLVGALTVGLYQRNDNGGSLNSTLTMGAGLLDAQTLRIGQRNGSINNAGGTMTSIVNVYGGTLAADTVIMGDYAGGNTVGTMTALLNLASNAVLEARVIQAGAYTGSVRQINWSSGVIRPYTNTDLSLSGVTVNLAGSGPRAFASEAGRSISVSALLTNAAGFAKAGAGTVLLHGVQPFSGAVTVSNGTLLVQGSAGSGGVLVETGGTLGGTGTVAGTVTVVGTVAPGAGGAGLLTMGDYLSVGGVLDIEVGGTVLGSQYDSVNVNSAVALDGSLNVSFINSFLPAGGDSFVVLRGAVSGTFAVENLPVLPGLGFQVQYFSTAVVVSVTGTLANVVWRPTLDADWNLTSSNWFDGAASTGRYEQGAIVTFDETGAYSNIVQLDPALAPTRVMVEGASNYTFAGAGFLTGSMYLTKTGAATLVLATTNDYAGDTTIGKGTLQLGDGGPAGRPGTGAIINRDRLVFAHSDAVALGNALSGTGAVVQAGPGTMSLSGALTYTGPTTVSNGTVRLDQTTAWRYSPTRVEDTGTLVLDTAGALDSWIYSFNSNLASLALSGTGTIVKTGPGWFQFDYGSPGSFAGRVLISNGVFGAGMDRSVWTNFRGDVTIVSNALGMGVLDLRSDNVTIDELSGQGEVWNSWNSQVSQLTVGAGDGSSTFGGRIRGAGGGGQNNPDGNLINLRKAGAGTLTLTGNNTLGGGSVVLGGVLEVDLIADSVASRLGTASGSANYLALQNGTLRFTGSGSNTTTRYLWIDQGDGTFDVTQAGGTLALLPSGGTRSRSITKIGAGTLVLGGAVTGTGQVTCAGGTLTLLATNTYAGGTTISNGTLLVNGSILSAVTVETNATLGGTGVVRGAVTQHGTIDPGASIGTLTISNQVSCSGTAVTRFELGGTNAPTDYDQLIVSDVHSLAGTLEVVTTNGYVPASGDSFLIISNSALGGALFGTFNTESLPTLAIGLGWVVQYNGTESVGLLVTGTVALATAYELWAQSITNPALRGEQEDPDGDGYANLFEYSQGSDATNAADNAKLGLVRTNGQFVAAFNRVNTATDIVYEVEGAYAPTNGALWLGIATNAIGSWGASTNVNDNNTATIHRVWVTDLELGTNRTLRLKITRP